MLGRNKNDVPGATVFEAYMAKLTYDPQAGALIIKKALRGQVVIPVAQIARVDTGNAGVGMKFGAFRTAAGQVNTNQQTRIGLGEYKDADNDPMAVTFLATKLNDFNAFTAFLQSEARRGPVAEPMQTEAPKSTPIPQADLGVQLANLADLHSRGILSAEEFASA